MTITIPSLGRVIPVLVIAFNRPSETTVILDQLANIAPESPFYIWQDGCKRGNNIDEKYMQTREIIKVFAAQRPNTNLMLNDNNMGCRVSVKKAIDWFFSNVDFGIICEDDIMISSQFFDFVARYKPWCEQYGNVGVIGGHSLIFHDTPFLNMHGSVWGWASWSRIWNLYSEKANLKLLKSNIDKYYSKPEATHELNVLQSFYESSKPIDTWDFHWLKTRIENEILTLMPRYPLTLNIGFGGGGTHYLNNKIPHFIKKSSLLFTRYALDPSTSIQNEPFVEPNLDPRSSESKKYFRAKFKNVLRTFLLP